MQLPTLLVALLALVACSRTNIHASSLDVDLNGFDAIAAQRRTLSFEELETRLAPGRGAVLGEVLNELGLVGVGAEVGVQRALHAEDIMLSWGGRRLVLIDAWHSAHETAYEDTADVPLPDHEANMAQAQRRMAPFAPRVEFLREWSLKAASKYPDSHFDFIYLDARHDYEGIRDDIVAWYPKLRSGGILAGHDWLDGHFMGTQYGVRRAVGEFAAREGKRVGCMECHSDWPSWFLLK
eukprot:tig00020538_g10366.t1